jgi:hypothetical protein
VNCVVWSPELQIFVAAANVNVVKMLSIPQIEYHANKISADEL